MVKPSSGQSPLVLASLVVLLVRGLGGLLGLVAAAAITRELGAAEAGIFFLAFAVLSAVAVVPRMGLDKTVLRFVSVAAAVGEPERVAGTLRLALAVVLLLASVMAGCLWLMAGLLAGEVFSNPGMAGALVAVAVTLPLFAACVVTAEALQGLRRFNLSVYILNISPWLWLLLIFFTAISQGVRADGLLACWAMAAAYALTLMQGLYCLRTCLHPRQAVVWPEWQQLRRSCLPLYGSDLMLAAVAWSSQLLAGYWLLEGEVAHLAAAQRVAAMTSLLLLAFNTVTAPRFASLHREGRHEALRRLAQQSTWMVLLAACPVVAMMCLFPGAILGLFGEEFTVAGQLLPVLALGQLFNAATGSVGYLLMMSGHERDMRNASVVAGVCAVILPVLLLPRFGVMGAVYSSAAALSLQNLLALLLVRRRLGFWTLGWGGGR